MTQHFRVVVIGGGVVGCNILYHLAREGWTDLALLERRDLTAGATWHSSGHISCFTDSPPLTAFGLYTRSMLRPLEEESGQDVGLRETGSLRLALDSANLRDFTYFANTPSGVATSARITTPSETAALWPLMEPGGLAGALFLPVDCHLNAADFTQALAKAARSRGARLFRQTEAVGLKPLPSGQWEIETTAGPFVAEHVVSATGIFARSTFRALGIALPNAVVSHQYMVTEPVDEIAQRRRLGAPPLPILRQPNIGMNIREEGTGLFISLYEKNTRPIFPDGPPRDFGLDLFPADYDSIEAGFDDAMARVPCLERAGIKSVVHGPMPWSPDFAPLVGPVPGLRNLWVAEGMSYGVVWSGGVARALARWIVQGDPGEDVAEIDCRRFGTYATPAWADPRAVRVYQGVYGDPNDTSLEARATPLHDLLAAEGARFEETYGWDCAVRFLKGEHSNTIASEIGAATSGLAIHEPAPMAKFIVSGAEARIFLDTYFATPTPTEPLSCSTRVSLSDRGAVASLYRVVCQEKESFYLIGESLRERREADRLAQAAEGLANLQIENRSDEDLSLMFLADRARAAALRDLAGIPEGEDCPQGRAFRVTIAGSPVVMMRRRNLGHLERWEMIHWAAAHRSVYLACRERLAEFEPAHLGTQAYRALQVLAAEPAYGYAFMEDCTPDGREISGPPLFDQLRKQFNRKLMSLKIALPDDAELLGNEGLFDRDDRLVGRITAVAQSPDDGHWAAFAFVDTNVAFDDDQPCVRLDGRSVAVRKVATHAIA